ncbi:MAG: hypothetical protein IH624_16425 [Phycisphaerae bacterium]|nr:hypothetical protein [Phycisphaerae bacterium]
MGIRQAAGEIIGIFDADHVLNPDLVSSSGNRMRLVLTWSFRQRIIVDALKRGPKPSIKK